MRLTKFQFGFCGVALATAAMVCEFHAADESEALAANQDPDAIHAELLLEDSFPSATTCAPCHPTHFREWSISQHAYAQMSPIFNAMAGKIFELTNGTNGDFCIRCHTPVGMNLNEREFMSNIDRHPTSREGVTCIVCHRVNQAYGKISGRLAIEQGEVTAPVYGPVGDDEELKRIIRDGGVITESDKAGRKIHGEVEKLFALTVPSQCGSCHDVTLVNGFRLEEAFSEYKNSPAAKDGVTCQDCHMGIEPGRILADKGDPEFEKTNYAFGSAAKVGSLTTEPRKLTNHLFSGPDYSVLPPALFPFNVDAIKEESEKEDPTARGLATIREWLEFDWKAGWGTDDFEDSVADDYEFPERWDSVDDRYDARDIVDANLALLEESRVNRLKLLQNGYKIGEIEVKRASSKKGIGLRVEVQNGTDGHNVPTGFDGERLVWLFVQLHDSDGNLIYQSGDLDPNGDVRDLHSLYVHNHELPLDKDLFSLQSKFITRNVRGGEREQVLAVNYSPSPLPFLRPEPRSTTLQGRPSGARKHKVGIPPLGSRWASYQIGTDMLSGSGTYTLSLQLKAAMVPVNLIHEIQSVGFDYNLSPREIADALIEGHQVIWERKLDVNVE